MKIIKLLIKNVKGVQSEKLKVRTMFCGKDLSSVNLLSKTDDFIKMINSLRKADDFMKHDKFA